MARIIFVSKNGNSIKLRDSEGHNPGNDDITTLVSPGDKVKWKLDNNSNLFSIESVQKSSGTTLWESPPADNGNGVYVATIKNDRNLDGKTENYTISYKVTRDGGVKSDDPRLKVKV